MNFSMTGFAKPPVRWREGPPIRRSHGYTNKLETRFERLIQPLDPAFINEASPQMQAGLLNVSTRFIFFGIIFCRTYLYLGLAVGSR